MEKNAKQPERVENEDYEEELSTQPENTNYIS